MKKVLCSLHCGPLLNPPIPRTSVITNLPFFAIFLDVWKCALIKKVSWAIFGRLRTNRLFTASTDLLFISCQVFGHYNRLLNVLHCDIGSPALFTSRLVRYHCTWLSLSNSLGIVFAKTFALPWTGHALYHSGVQGTEQLVSTVPGGLTTNSSHLLAAGDIDHPMLLPVMFQESAQVWAIAPSLLLVHVCGTIYHFISVTVNCHFSSFTVYWKRICLAEDYSA